MSNARVDSGVDGAVTYYWTCENRTTYASACMFSSGGISNAFDQSAPSITFGAGEFWAPSTMLWTLKVTKAGIVDTTYVTINVVSTPTVSVGIITVKENLRVSRNMPVILSATAYSQYPYSLTYVWTSDPELSASAFPAGTSGKYLKISPYMLDEDSQYNFTCMVQDPSGAVGQSVIRVTVNRAPRHGGFSVTPSSGIAYETVFELRAYSWLDDDQPVTYVFSYQDPSTGEYVPLASRTESSIISTTLGVGKIAGTATVSIRVEVLDSLNASTTASASLTLTQSTSVSSDSLLTKARESTSTGDQKLAEIAAAVNALNCTAEPEKCGTALGLMRAAEWGSEGTAESDETILGVLAAANITSGSNAGAVVDILSDLAIRESAKMSLALSIADDQLESKMVQYGLASDDIVSMLTILADTISGMDTTQLQSSQDSVTSIADTAGRSLIKDAVPDEPATVVETSSLTVLAQKVAACGNSSKVYRGVVRGIEFSMPICDVLPAGQTTFVDKTANSESPYDLLVEVFDQNVMGDCVPLSSKMLRVVIYNDETKAIYTSATGIQSGINFTFQLNSAFPSVDPAQVHCMYYSAKDSAFVPTTMSTSVTNSAGRTFNCTTTHLSEFALLYATTEQSKSIIDPEFWILLALFVTCIAMNVWAAIHDARLKAGITAEVEEKTQALAHKIAVARMLDTTAARENAGARKTRPAAVRVSLKRKLREKADPGAALSSGKLLWLVFLVLAALVTIGGRERTRW